MPCIALITRSPRNAEASALAWGPLPCDGDVPTDCSARSRPPPVGGPTGARADGEESMGWIQVRFRVSRGSPRAEACRGTRGPAVWGLRPCPWAHARSGRPVRRRTSMAPTGARAAVPDPHILPGSSGTPTASRHLPLARGESLASRSASARRCRGGRGVGQPFGCGARRGGPGRVTAASL